MQKESKEITVAKISAKTAIITAIVTAMASILGTWLSIQGTSERQYKIVAERALALRDEWTGKFIQADGPDGIAITNGLIRLSFSTGKRLIQGHGRMEHNRTNGTATELEFTFEGGFLYDRFLRLETSSADATKIQFGSIVAELSSDGRQLKGQYVGYGAQSQRIVHGSLELNR